MTTKLEFKELAKEVETQDKKLINYKIGEKKYFVKKLGYKKYKK
jgi:hypothetical protein